MNTDQSSVGRGNTAPATETGATAAQYPLLAGFALHTIDGRELLTPHELSLAVRVQLPADLPAGIAPTLQPNDVVILTPLSLRPDPMNTVVFLQLNTAPDAYAVGRLAGQDGNEWVLTDNVPGSETWVHPDHIRAAWAVRLLVNRKIS